MTSYYKFTIMFSIGGNICVRYGSRFGLCALWFTLRFVCIMYLILVAGEVDHRLCVFPLVALLSRDLKHSVVRPHLWVMKHANLGTEYSIRKVTGEIGGGEGGKEESETLRGKIERGRERERERDEEEERYR